MSNWLKRWWKVFIGPEFSVRLHATMLILWFIPGTVVTLLWLSSAVAWVSWMSLYAIVIGHWSALQAAHAEKRVKDDNDGDDD